MDDLVALDDLSFTVREGQMFGFVGPNGAGKTTAMRIVLGVLEPDRGEVRWRGRPVDVETRRRFGYMPNPSSAVGEHMAFGIGALSWENGGRVLVRRVPTLSGDLTGSGGLQAGDPGGWGEAGGVQEFPLGRGERGGLLDPAGSAGQGDQV
jgi:ABC transporter